MPKIKKIVSILKFKRKHYANIKRFKPNILIGLNIEQVKTRISQNKINVAATPQTKSFFAILKDSAFSLFNLINIILAAALLYVGSSYKNILFLGVVFSNLIINLVQEIRAKRATDKLSLLSAATATVRRNRQELELRSEEVVLDDIILYSPGKQIVTDSYILEGECEVNEAFLTGESEPVYKVKGDMLFSGSFISSGSCTAQADSVGTDNASYEITAGAKKMKTRASEIVKSLRKIIRVISVILVPLGVLFFLRQNSHDTVTITVATEHTVSALIGMIPEGLILLTSTVLAVIVVKLARKKVLVNELYSIEMLARVDTICLDKTGTLTEGSMKVEDIILIDPERKDEVNFALASINESLTKNETMESIGRFLQGVAFEKAESTVPFSSKKKWCGVYFVNKGAYILGAPEIVLNKNETGLLIKANDYAKNYRVLCLSFSHDLGEDGILPENRTALSLLLLSDTIRTNAKETIEYFKKQGVAVKIISGDNPLTVSNVAKKVGVDGYENSYDMTMVTDDSEIEKIADKYVIFGRTTPIQKQLLIKALRKKGHTVAMTGDGVNDVLAMKEADCSISVAQGTDAARTVADIVLLNSSFEAVPKIVDEGRMAINNLQRTSSLFIVKTIYSALLTIVFLFWSFPYPFIPIQLTLISSVGIGIPAFFLAFELNKDRVKGKFIANILLKAAPAGISIFIGIIATHIVAIQINLTQSEIGTICVLTTGSIALLGVLFISMPLNKLRLLLVIILSGTFIVCIFFFREVFELYRLSLRANISLLIIVCACGFIFWLLKKMFTYKVLQPK
ncbi:MAG: hypothetical protein A2Y15_06660 [Clostridiales bacterium GWF2_36_10]|nr:MAG: hypothetical protein A2Y15_06660 [Clostridiales bacterium GWF2_36_10]HAN21233.1 ATPase P [Clostridiales bacterium]